MTSFVGHDTGFTVFESGEVLRVDAWGPNAARLRSTIGPSIGETPGSALCDPPAVDVQVEIAFAGRRDPAQRRADRRGPREPGGSVHVVPAAGAISAQRWHGAAERAGAALQLSRSTALPAGRRRPVPMRGRLRCRPARAVLRVWTAPARAAGPEGRGDRADPAQHRGFDPVHPLEPRLWAALGHARRWARRAGDQRHALGGRRCPSDRLLGDFAGASPAQIVSQYAQATGLPPMLPVAFGRRASGRSKAALPQPGGAAGGGARVQGGVGFHSR